MVRLSVNVNKIATLRNSRTPPDATSDHPGVPSIARAVDVCLAAGARGITVHPREDQRHVTPGDVRAVAERIAPVRDQVEFNIEGDPRPDLLALVHEVVPHQLTLVPVRPGEVTSEAGWPADTPHQQLGAVIEDAKAAGIRVSVFVEPRAEAIRWAAGIGADRVELYTEPYAMAFRRSETEGARAMAPYVEAAELAHTLGLGINAGHDLDLANLPRFRTLPHLDEVSIGHALLAEAVFDGLDAVVRRYLDVLARD
ncbi:MAG: pyridoxine 5'-phosphate synthase [Deltaproteobacteria bacterium]|nr:pyridoxine 5'-phosphate synthase [Deltaproteobacteria bacterium]